MAQAEKKEKPKISIEKNFIVKRFFSKNKCQENAIEDQKGKKTTFISLKIKKGKNKGVVNRFCVKEEEAKKNKKGKFKGTLRLSRQASLKPISNFEIKNGKIVRKKVKK